jgi:hypothetical protein
VRCDAKQYVLHIDAENRMVRQLDLSWYDGGAYDLLYQSLIDAMTLPNHKRALVSVQRSSQLVEIDIERNMKVGYLELAGRSGNPPLSISSQEALITTDYDAICRVDIERRETVKQRLLQEPDGQMRHFVGSPSAVGATHVLLPRPS